MLSFSFFVRLCEFFFIFFFYFAICSQLYSSSMSLFVQSDNLSTMNASVCTSTICELYKRFQDVCKRARTSSDSWVFCRLFCRGMNKSSVQAFCDAVRANQHICSFCFELSRYTQMRVIYFIIWAICHYVEVFVCVAGMALAMPVCKVFGCKSNVIGGSSW